MKKTVIIIMLAGVCLCTASPAFAGKFINAQLSEVIEKVQNEQTAYDFFTGEMGFNSAAACGILANIECESGFEPDIYGDYGESYGICQWYMVRFSRLREFCAAYGYEYSSMEGQLQYLAYELLYDSAYSHVLNYLRSVPDTAEGAYNAGYYWCYCFEIPEGYDSWESPRRAEIAVATYWEKYHEKG